MMGSWVMQVRSGCKGAGEQEGVWLAVCEGGNLNNTASAEQADNAFRLLQGEALTCIQQLVTQLFTHSLPCCAIPCHFMRCSSASFTAVAFYAMLYHSMLCCAIYAMLRHSMLCCVILLMLCYSMQCCVILCHALAVHAMLCYSSPCGGTH